MTKSFSYYIMDIMNKKTSIIILILVSIAVHFAFFGRPNETVFDEVHFGKFVSGYYTHQYYFDIHPPGGKLIIAGFAKLFNFSPEYSFAEIGQKFPDNKYLALRFLPMLAGMLLPIIIYLLALELGFSILGAFGAGMLIALENSLLTQSRLILLDPFLLLFGFASLLFYFKYRSHSSDSSDLIPNSYFLILMSIFGGLAFSIKWTGIAFLGLVGLIELIHTVKNNSLTIRYSLLAIAKLFVFFVIIPLTIYFSIFVIHFSLLTKSGDGDAFMTPEFQSSLQDSDYADDSNLKPLNIFQKFIELNAEMYTANKNLTATHPYSSQWYTWPFMVRPIYYWNQSSIDTPTQSKIYLIGNPFIWWASTVAILYLLISTLFDFVSRKYKAWKHIEVEARNKKQEASQKSMIHDSCFMILIGGYVINYLPFIGIGRVMFLYHYLSALIFAILTLAYLIDQHPKRKKIFMTVIILAGLAFLFFAPLSYGLPLEANQLQNRFWFNTWQ